MPSPTAFGWPRNATSDGCPGNRPPYSVVVPQYGADCHTAPPPPHPLFSRTTKCPAACLPARRSVSLSVCLPAVLSACLPSVLLCVCWYARLSSPPGGSLRNPTFFFGKAPPLRTAPRDHQPPTAANRQPPPTANHQPPRNLVGPILVHEFLGPRPPHATPSSTSGLRGNFPQFFAVPRNFPEFFAISRNFPKCFAISRNVPAIFRNRIRPPQTPHPQPLQACTWDPAQAKRAQ